MFLGLFLEEILNLQTKMLECVCSTHHTQNSHLGTRSRLGDLLRLRPFNFHLDSFFEEIPNLNREIWNSHHSTCYTQIGVLGTRSRSGDLLHSTCIWTHFLRRFQIRTEKFEILNIAHAT